MAIYNPKTKKWEENTQIKSERLIYNPKTKKWTTRALIADSNHNGSGYFQKSEGNVIQTVGGTVTDVAENAVKGRAGWWEKFIDGLLMVGASMNYNTQMQAANDEIMANFILGNDASATKTLQGHLDYQNQVEAETMKFVAKDLINEEKVAKAIIDPVESAVGIDTEGSYSVIGNKGDALVQSGTDLLVRRALNKVPVVGQALSLVTTGATVLGAEAENAARQNATFEDAFTSGMISAGAEIGTEYLFGGIKFGGKTLTEGIVSKIASKVPNKFLSTLAKWGINTAGEGFEEVASGWLSAAGQKITYLNEKELGELFTWGDAWDNFVGGVILGGLFEGINIASAKNNNIDYVTELSQNERTVLDKVYQDTINQEQQNGKKLTSKEKTEIFDKVIENMQKGYIPTDSIDSVLGGEAYSNYQNALSQEESLKKEINSLKNKKNKTDVEKQRLAEAREQLKAIDKNALKTTLDNQIANTIKKDSQNLSKVKGRESYLSESYRENVRRGQAFEADLNQYRDEYSKQTIKNIMDSGIANNTNLTHEFADMLAKMSADQKTVFDFTDNQKLKESIFGVDGKTVNGYITKDGITINLNSPKALQTIVGHEISHVLEGTELYGSLQSELKSYLGDAEYNKRLAAIKETYKDIYKGEDAETKFEQELTADLVGDLLFTDKKFVSRLYNNNQGLFHKMFDEVKYLCRVATAGSKQARQLEKIKHTFEEVYKEGAKAQKNTAQEDGVRYSLSQNAESELHKALYDKNYKGEVKLRDESPAIMLAQKGVKNLPMSMKVSHIRENIFTEAEAKKLGLKIDEHTHYHGLGEKFYLQIIDGLDNVKEAYRGTKNADDSSRRENYFLLVSEFVDKDGNTINVPVYIDEHARVNRVFIDVNKISTAFGRENFRDYINRQIQNKNLVRIKNRSNQTSESNALIARGYGEEASNNSISNSDENVKQKDIFGFSIDENANVNEDLLEELSVFHPEAEVDNQGNVTVYHRTSKESADKIKQSGIMTAKEDALFFSSKESGYASDYGDTVLKFRIPSTVLQVNDIFDGEVHFDIPLKYKNGTFSLDVSEYLVKDDSALQGKRSLSSETDDIAPVKDGIYGKDVLLDDLPIRQTVSKTETVDDVVGDIPIRSDIKPNKSEAESANGIDDLPIADKYVSTRDKFERKLNSFKASISANEQNKANSYKSFNEAIEKKQAEYDVLSNKNTKKANNILQQIENLKLRRDNVQADYDRKISAAQERYDALEGDYEKYATADQRKKKQKEYSDSMDELVGDTSTWKDKKLGISYKVNTLRRNLRDIIRKADGSRDIAKADAIYDELQGKYNHNEAELNRESNRIKKVYADLKITKAEDTYIQMLGEFRHNPDSKLTEADVKEFYEKNKKNIDAEKVDKVIDMARETYDSLLQRVNEVLREQGMKEIPYRQGYFPHFTEEKQGLLAKIFNWKTRDDNIPTDIAGLTEQFNPNRSWQSFNKQRKGDTTDYSFMKGLDAYVQGSLDWVYHIEDIQKRRAFENHIRYVHSEKGIQDKIDAIRKNDEYDADEMQEQIDLVYKEAGNPLNNFVSDFRTQTNSLTGKKSSMDRGMEGLTNRKIYSTMTNISNRVTANMVGGSISSALTNFIPITQSWGRVSPVSSLRAMGETIRSTFRDDGTIAKSDFLTNRLRKSENLYKTTWDKVSDKAGALMEAVDSFTSQVVWRSKYMENMSKGMSEAASIKDADQFAENVLAGRSRGNNPTIFDSKNPLVKAFTAFQLEVNNQYGYMFKDMPQDMKNESVGKLVKGYATMYLGAYAYNALFSMLTGRDSAFDPIGIIEDLLRDLGILGDDEEEEPIDVVGNLAENVVEELPFVGGLFGGGRIPISSALPYGEGVVEMFSESAKDIADEDWKGLTKEWLNPVYYLAMPVGGGQLRKTVQGLDMFDDDLPIAGSYTDSGKLRFPVEDTTGNKIKAGVFGQWSSKNARDYFDKGWTPLNDKQIQEYKDSNMSYEDYQEYRKGLKDFDNIADKVDYIAGLDLPIGTKNTLANNLSDRKEPIDLTGYEDYSSYEEFEYASKNSGKYAISRVAGGYDSYKGYTDALNNIKSDKDNNGNTISGSRKKKVVEYINGLDASYGEKIVLFKSQYPADDTYNYEIVDYLNSRGDLSYSDMETILMELGFKVDSKGNISW